MANVLTNNCCKCQSTWNLKNTYLSGTAVRETSPIYKPYRFIEGSDSPPDCEYGYDQVFEIDDNYNPPKTFPWKLKILESSDVNDYGSSSDCDCTSSANKQFLYTTIEQEWTSDGRNYPNTYLEHKAKWWCVPNQWHGTGLNPDGNPGKGWSRYKLQDCKLQWSYKKRLSDRIEKDFYKADHECGLECPNGPEPSGQPKNSSLRTEFRNWKPTW